MTVVRQPATVRLRFHTTDAATGTPRRRRMTREAAWRVQAPEFHAISPPCVTTTRRDAGPRSKAHAVAPVETISIWNLGWACGP